MKRTIILAVVALAITATALGEVKTVEINMSKLELESTNKIGVNLEEGDKFVIKLKNILPSMKYIIEYDGYAASVKPKTLSVNKDAKGCAEFYEAEKFNLFYEIDEKVVSMIRNKFFDNIKKYCESESQKARYTDSIDALTSAVVFESGAEYDLAASVKIRRPPTKENKGEREWDVKFVSEPTKKKSKDRTIAEGDRWMISYGFSYPIMFSTAQRYYTAASDSVEGKFEIHKMRDNEYIRFIPSIFLHWNTMSGEDKHWNISVAGGVGFDSDNPIILWGVAMTYRCVLSFNFGALVHKVSKLHGRYSEGDIISEILDYEQLHTMRYRINPFFGVSFRFDSFTRDSR